MRNKTTSTEELQRSNLLRWGAFGFMAALIGLMMWAANAQFNNGTEGYMYYLSWGLIILGISTAIPNVYGFVTLVGEPHPQPERKENET
jgi:hypothetical protein